MIVYQHLVSPLLRINLLLHKFSENGSIMQGTYVEGIKEEVVLSPAHALSLIASGEGINPRTLD